MLHTSHAVHAQLNKKLRGALVPLWVNSISSVFVTRALMPLIWNTTFKGLREK